MDRKWAHEALKLYDDLSVLDAELHSLKNNKNPLQSVTFYHYTSYSSGPHTYKPKYFGNAILRSLIEDMQTERVRLCACLKDLGFEPPLDNT